MKGLLFFAGVFMILEAVGLGVVVAIDPGDPESTAFLIFGGVWTTVVAAIGGFFLAAGLLT